MGDKCGQIAPAWGKVVSVRSFCPLANTNSSYGAKPRTERRCSFIIPRLELKKDKFTISDDPTRLDLDTICDFLARSYWAEKRSRATIERSIKHSLNFGVYDGDRQVGFARVVTDYAVFAYLCDVFIHEEYRG